MENMNNMLLIFNAVIGVYATYAAIRGTGAAYKNDYPEAIRDDANALLRKFLFILGPLMLVSAAVEYFNIFGTALTRILTFVFIAAAIILVVIYIVIFRKRYGKYLK